MITIYSDDHRAHHAAREMQGGVAVPAVEKPARLDSILARIGEVGLGPVRPPDGLGLDPVRRVHTAPYLAFLEQGHTLWSEQFGDIDAAPFSWPARGLRGIEPKSIEGRLGYYAGDVSTPITGGTWRAATAAADVAATGACLIADGARSAFALCRPPGHHASADVFNGYCYLNNAAIAAQVLCDRGAGRVAVLDIDYHHGNGTQDIFYRRGDVLFVSLHADPAVEYPFFLGHADEVGEGAGAGATLNLPMPLGTGYAVYGPALDRGLDAIDRFAPDAMVVSFGADTYDGDPISAFRLTGDDFSRLGQRIGRIARPVLVVMEGGYAVDALGRNTVNFLAALEGAQT